MPQEINANAGLHWSVPEAAQATGLSESMLRLEIRQGKLMATKIGKRLLIQDINLQAYLEAHICPSASDELAADGPIRDDH